MRINKFVARATGMARRKADSLVSGGHIQVNGKPAQVGQDISDADSVTLAGKELKLPTYKYIMLHKPVGYVSSRQSQKDAKTVYDLLPPEYRHLKLVGRLDKDTSGLILLTDDGDFAHSMMHPSQGKTKTYEVELDKPIDASTIEHINRGVELEDGVSHMKIISSNKNNLTLELEEGRNRQIRRSFLPLGYEVIKLHRTTFGKYKLDTLKVSDFTDIKP